MPIAECLTVEVERFAKHAFRLGEVAARSGTFPTQLLEHARSEASQAGFLERIDFVLLSPAAAARAQRVAMPRGDALDEVSDHYPVVVDLAPR